MTIYDKWKKLHAGDKEALMVEKELSTKLFRKLYQKLVALIMHVA